MEHLGKTTLEDTQTQSDLRSLRDLLFKSSSTGRTDFPQKDAKVTKASCQRLLDRVRIEFNQLLSFSRDGITFPKTCRSTPVPPCPRERSRAEQRAKRASPGARRSALGLACVATPSRSRTAITQPRSGDSGHVGSSTPLRILLLQKNCARCEELNR